MHAVLFADDDGGHKGRGRRGFIESDVLIKYKGKTLGLGYANRYT